MISPKDFLKTAGISYVTIKEITPYFLCITTKKGIPFWFGAMTLICEYEGHKIPILELPKKMRGLSLKTEDLIAHERVHFYRAAFNEPRFEELIAYRTSRSKWRKHLGPLFQKPWESYVCMALFIPSTFYWPSMLLTISYLSLLFIRLLLNQFILKKAFKNLIPLHPNPEQILALLTDSEILKTSRNKILPLNTPPGHLLLKTLGVRPAKM